MENKYFKVFLIFLASVSFLRILLLNLFNLVPQEAYYWLYIQRPALSYFDHPPLCSYTIGVFTGIFGNTEFAIRFGMLLYSIGTSFFLFFLSKKFFNSDRKALLTIVFLNLTIFFNLHSIVATPDAPLLFFWSGAMYFFFKALFEGDKWQDWLLAGFFAGLAFSSKYTGAFIFLNLFLFFVFTKDLGKLFNKKFLSSLIISLIVFSPVIVWNLQNGFASFLFQTSERAKGIKSFGLNYFFQLIASQIYELTPLFFLLLIILFFKYISNNKSLDSKTKFILTFSYPMVIFFFLVSFTSLVKMNWILPSYLAFTILVVDFFEKSKERFKIYLKYLGLSLSIILIVLNLTIILFPIVPIEKGDSWTGWPEIANRIVQLKQAFDKENNTFIFSNEYKIPAELSFYTPFKDVVLAENVYGKPALQFDFWFDVEKFAGWDGIFVYSDFNPSVNLEEVGKFFQKMEFVEEFKIEKNKKIFRKFYIYRCRVYTPPKG